MKVLELYEEMNMWVEYLTMKKYLDVPTAQDVCQDTFIRLYEKFGDADIGHPNVPALLMASLKNRSVNNYRKDTRVHTLNISYMADYLRLLNSTDHKIEVELDVLFRLAPDYYTLLMDFYIYNMSYKKLAQQENISEDAIRARLKRARIVLKSSIDILRPFFNHILKEKK